MLTSKSDALDILFTMWEGGGNVTPTLQVARQLSARGHQVRWLGDASMAGEVKRAGIAFIPWREAPNRTDRSRASDFLRDYEGAGPDQFKLLRDRLMIGPCARYARDVVREIRRRPTHLIVSSEMLIGTMIAAEFTRLPLALFGPNLSLFPLPGLPPLGAGLSPARTPAERAQHDAIRAAYTALLNEGLPSLNSARAQFALAPLADVTEQVAAAQLYLLGTSRAFDFTGDTPPPHVRYVGPLLDDPGWAQPWQSPWPSDDPRPLVLVGFSTTDQNQADVLKRTAEALGSLEVRAVITLGPALQRDSFPASANVHLCASAPHGAILREASAVVTHAGHGTVMRALAADVPLLCLPMGRDQNDNAARVVAREAGILLAPTASVVDIRAAINKLLSDPTYRRGAARLGAAIRADISSSAVIAELEGIAVQGVPAARTSAGSRA